MANPRLDDFGGLLDWPRLQTWFRQHDLPGEGPITAVTQLSGGSQNNIFRLERAGASLVLRRPPTHPRPNSNETIMREATVLTALAGSNVPHPHVHGIGHDPTVIGTCFYVMDDVDGFTPRGQLPGSYAIDPGWRRLMATQIVDAAANLSEIDPAGAGLERFGRSEGWVERQVGRWSRHLDDYQQLDGYTGRTLDGVAEVATWLEANRPTTHQIGIIHGDLQFANVLFATDRPELVAVIDWELSTLGDPLLDLGWILTSWHEAGDPPGHAPYVEPFDDFPTRAELSERYATATGRDLALVPWYFTLACFKLAILIEGTYARALSGLAPMETGERLHRNALWFLTKARHLISI